MLEDDGEVEGEGEGEGDMELVEVPVLAGTQLTEPIWTGVGTRERGRGERRERGERLCKGQTTQTGSQRGGGGGGRAGGGGPLWRLIPRVPLTSVVVYPVGHWMQEAEKVLAAKVPMPHGVHAVEPLVNAEVLHQGERGWGWGGDMEGRAAVVCVTALS